MTCIIWDNSFIPSGFFIIKSNKPKTKKMKINIKYEKGFFCLINLLNSNNVINPKIRIKAKKVILFWAANINMPANKIPEIDRLISSLWAKL